MFIDYIIYIKNSFKNCFKVKYSNTSNTSNNIIVCPPYYAPFRYS